MTTIEVATAKVHPHPKFHEEDDLTAWVCVAHYESNGEVWTFVGASEVRADARQNLVALLLEHGIEAPIQLNECLDSNQRRRLIWSAKSRAMLDGVALVTMEE